MEKLDLNKDKLKKFGITMGIAFVVITIFILFKHRHNILPTVIISVTFFALAFTAPILLKPLYIIWMRFAYILAWINTRLILFIIFYLIFTPVGLVMRLFKVDLLDRKIDKHKESYWRKKEKGDFKSLNYERRF